MLLQVVVHNIVSYATQQMMLSQSQVPSTFMGSAAASTNPPPFGTNVMPGAFLFKLCVAILFVPAMLNDWFQHF